MDKYFGKHDIEMFKERLIKYRNDNVSVEAIKNDFRNFFGNSEYTEIKLDEIIKSIGGL